MIKGLLTTDPEKRLKISDIKRHKFLTGTKEIKIEKHMVDV
jgi:hypothetical protein